MNSTPQILDALPTGFFGIEARDIRRLFPQPTLVRLHGAKAPALFVSILLHGNEYTGLKVMQRLLGRYDGLLPRSLWLFVGNVYAAEQGLRVLPGQTDYNRCWPGTEMAENEETQLMQRVIDEVTRNELFAAIDIHNNTGTNPLYACMTDPTRRNQHLASLFNHIAVVFHYPKGVSTMAFDGICPAVTLECGKPGDELGIERAVDLIDGLMHLDHFPDRPVPPHDLQLVETQATVRVPDDVSFDFNLSAQADLTFDHGFERRNFTEMKPTEVFAYTRVPKPLIVTNDDGEDITDELLRIENGKVYLNRPLMPAMITLDKTIVRQDCLCYLMTDYQPRPEHRPELRELAS